MICAVLCALSNLIQMRFNYRLTRSIGLLYLVGQTVEKQIAIP